LQAIRALLQDLTSLRAALLYDAEQLSALGTAWQHIQSTEADLATAFVTRALVLLVTLVVNQRNPLMSMEFSMAQDLYAVMRGLYNGSIQCYPQTPWLPHLLQKMTTNIALEKWG
jgi:hypothetical protein